MPILLLLILSRFSFAASLSVSPPFLEIEKPAGQTLSETITIFNGAEEKVRIVLYVGDFWYNKSGVRTFPRPGSSPYSAASWVVIPQREIEVPAKGQADTSFLFSIPAQAPSSGYATLFIEQQDAPQTMKKKSSVGISLRIAVPVLYQRQDVAPSGLVMDRFAIDKPSRFKPFVAKFHLRNEDVTYAFPEGTILVVRSGSKELVAKDEIKKEKVILPNQTLPYEVALPITPEKGKYEGVLSLFYGKQKSVVQTFDFSIP